MEERCIIHHRVIMARRAVRPELPINGPPFSALDKTRCRLNFTTNGGLSDWVFGAGTRPFFRLDDTRFTRFVDVALAPLFTAIR